MDGSSPLARGTQLRYRYTSPLRRLIPARAGNTEFVQTARRSCPAHPRSHGEHFDGDTVHDVGCGSSPLARGTLMALAKIRMLLRLIPARAGNTRYPSARPAARTAHPRSRGEHLSSNRSMSMRCGSSPLARGTQSYSKKESKEHRLIPARAGNTGGRRQFMSWQTAHPRSRGEHPNNGFQSGANLGSSPLARGTRDWVPEDLAPDRLIPARAGNTTTKPSTTSP